MNNQKPLDNRLRAYSSNKSIRLGVVQQDYLLSWILIGLAHVPELRANMIFKGGTALKKCYFGEYRFSEDLDFTALPGLLKGNYLEEKIDEAVNIAERLLEKYAPITITCERYREKNRHPGSQEAFKIRAKFPKQREPLVTAMIEITFDEAVAILPEERKIMHAYEEMIEAKILTYSLEEIVIEKLRGILQKTKKSHERSWTRSRARDYYDLWNIFRVYQERLNFETIHKFLPEKCRAKDVTFTGVDDFFDSAMIEQTIKDWRHHLYYLVSDLPEFEIVKNELRNDLETLIFSKNMKNELMLS
ncbi:MAG: hypothetical protein KR126chlam2_00611 [Chlamydiae bacterium]|nr:hypothetical protein [Chlamydiota bacterium]